MYILNRKFIALISFLIFAPTVSAQDYDYLTSLNSLTKDQAINVGKDLAGSGYRIYKIKDMPQVLHLQLIPSGILDESIKEGKNDGATFVDLSFVKLDNDKVKITMASAPEELFQPFWQKYFKPEAAKDVFASDYKLHKVVNREKGIEFKAYKSSSGWRLSNGI